MKVLDIERRIKLRKGISTEFDENQDADAKEKEESTLKEARNESKSMLASKLVEMQENM